MPFHPERKTNIANDEKKEAFRCSYAEQTLCVCGKGEKQKSIKQQLIIMLRIWKRAIECNEGTIRSYETKK